MFVVSLTYKCSLSEVDQQLEAHVAYLREQYAQGHFIASGRKVPRTGGIVLAKAASKEALEKILAEDPFAQNDLADYTITEFTASMVGEGFEKLQE
ncbi:MAG: YciI family protein [Desulfobulbaceae bacterium]|nr:YciI family protein [Desulfobulbaceae bacterium]